MFDDADLGTIFSDPENVSYAASKYNRLLCEGLAQNGVRVETAKKYWFAKNQKKAET